MAARRRSSVLTDRPRPRSAARKAATAAAAAGRAGQGWAWRSHQAHHAHAGAVGAPGVVGLGATGNRVDGPRDSHQPTAAVSGHGKSRLPCPCSYKPAVATIDRAVTKSFVAFPCSRDPPCARRPGAELLLSRTTQDLDRRAEHGVIPGLAAPASDDRLGTTDSLVRSGARSAPYVRRHLRRYAPSQPKLLRPAQQVLD